MSYMLEKIECCDMPVTSTVYIPGSSEQAEVKMPALQCNLKLTISKTISYSNTYGRTPSAIVSVDL